MGNDSIVLPTIRDALTIRVREDGKREYYLFFVSSSVTYIDSDEYTFECMWLTLDSFIHLFCCTMYMLLYERYISPEWITKFI